VGEFVAVLIATKEAMLVQDSVFCLWTCRDRRIALALNQVREAIIHDSPLTWTGAKHRMLPYVAPINCCARYRYKASSTVPESFKDEAHCSAIANRPHPPRLSLHHHAEGETKAAGVY
jgi:hypothetical protein